MTDTPGSPGPGAADETPTPSQGFPKPDVSGATPASSPSQPASPATTGGSAAGPTQPETGGPAPITPQQGMAGDGSGPAPLATPGSVTSGGVTSGGVTAGGTAPGSPAAGGADPASASGASTGPDDAKTPPSGLPRQGPPPFGAQHGTPGQWQSPGATPQPPMPQYPGGAYGRPGGWNPQGLGKPGVIALRPLNIGDILDGSITAIRRYPVLVLGVSAVVAVLVSALNLVVSLTLLPDVTRVTAPGPGATPQEQLDAAYSLLGSAALALIPTLIITLLGQTFLTGFLTVVMGKAVLGRPVDFRTAMREAGPRLLPLLGLTLLYALTTLVASFFCLLPAVIPYVFWALAGPALVLERGTIRQAFGRSRRLVSGAFWRVFGVLLLATLIGLLISGIIELPFNLGSGAFSGLFDPRAMAPQRSTGGLVLQSVGSVIAATIVTPFTALVTVVLYIDQRMRREGMDIELARAAGLNPPAPPRQAW